MKHKPTKKILIGMVITLILFFAFGSITFAEDGGDYTKYYEDAVRKIIEQEMDKRTKPPCDKGFKDESKCLSCHTSPSMKLKEASPDEGREYPYNTKVRNGIGYYSLGKISSVQVWTFFDYLRHHNIKKAVIEINSPGGSLFDAWTIFSYMDKFDGTVETRVRSYAASAGCLIFVGGDIGKRFIEPTAMLMWHELLTFKFLSIETPSSTEDQAKILRKMQDTGNKWLAARTKLTKDKIDEKVKRKEFWITGKEALEEYGFADGFIGE